MKEIADIIRLWQRHRGEPLALATLVRAEGSSYRRPGARMLICSDGATAGSLSGGCLEEEVVQRAREVLRSGRPSLMAFDTRRRFGCNGKIEIFVEELREEFLADLNESMKRRSSCHAITVFAGDENELGSCVAADGAESDHAFRQLIEPPIHLIIFGEGPDSAPLRSIGELLGWSISEVAQASDLPVHADDRTAAIVKSHNYGRDCAALQHLFQLGLRYVGLLGPRRRRDEILGDLLDRDVAIQAELFAPAGLDLNAETPEEIALALAGEIQAVFADGSGESLRDRKAPIHAWNIAPRRCEPAAL